MDVLGVVEQAPHSPQEMLATLQQREIVSKVRRLGSVLSSVAPGSRMSDEAPTPLLEPFPLSALDSPVGQIHRTAASIIHVPGSVPSDGMRRVSMCFRLDFFFLLL